ncbi:MAG: M3 family oligoendopeptidase [Bacteroidetes bacterium]|nr:M3 family oligoendopeptidase [Bacteroidota bacterium]
MEIVAIEKKTRKFIPNDLIVENWAQLSPFFDKLLQHKINGIDDLLVWMENRSELGAAIDDEFRWRYIRQTCDTENEKLREEYEYFVSEISPKLMEINNQLNEKVAQSGLLDALEEKGLSVYVRGLKNSLELFREENIPLYTELNLKEQEYGQIIGRMTIQHNGEELTTAQANKLLQNEDRSLRETIFKKVGERRLQDKEALENLFDELIVIRDNIAKNAGFDNYRDYKFKELGRFDYGVKECEDFHDAVKNEVIPLVKKIDQNIKNKLGVSTLRPYDLDAPFPGEKTLKPFNGARELIEKSILTLDKIDPYFSWCLATMDKMNHFDLESRKGKGPGGYNMSMPELGVPFVFMNASGTHGDVTTMVHEAGHAVHSFLVKDLPFDFDKEVSSEVAELASMSMELFALEAYSTFYSDENDLKKTKSDQLERIITILPWIAIIDKFQHWIYTNIGHSQAERKAAWISISNEFSSGEKNWEGLEEIAAYNWHRQLHIFEVPFYYIEYGIAQLGALGMWKNFKENPKNAIENYKKALALGYTKSIPEMYETAGVPFNFTSQHIGKLMQFIQQELL